MSKSTISTRKIVFCAVLIALSTVTANYIKLPSLPFGGSTTLFSMFFITYAGTLFGPLAGLATGLAHGIIQFISKPYMLTPLQVILDYPLAFGALGLSGLFYGKKNALYKGYTIGVCGRFLFATISGLIFFTDYTGDAISSLNAARAGIIYNASYIFPEYVLTIIVLLMPPVRKGLAYIRKVANE